MTRASDDVTTVALPRPEVRPHPRGWSHVVVARSAVGEHYVGPFATEAEAMIAALHESRAWAASFPLTPVVFDVVAMAESELTSQPTDRPPNRGHLGSRPAPRSTQIVSALTTGTHWTGETLP